jgi:hypothetical protein
MEYIIPLSSLYRILGWVFLFLINAGTELFTFDYTIANFFICGWLSAGTSYLLSMVVKDDGIQIGAKND